jgi:hypothetical protein
MNGDSAFGRNGLDGAKMSDNIVTMKTMTRRELSRQPSKLDGIKPGQSVRVPDSKGGLVVSRPKKNKMSAGEMFSELDKVAGECPAMDTKSFLEEGE